MSDVTKLYPANAAFSPDNVLEQAIGEYEKVIVIGRGSEGYLDMRSSTNMNMADTVLALSQAKTLLSNTITEDFVDPTEEL